MHIDTSVVVAVLAVLSFIFAVVGVLGQWKVSRNTTALTQYRDIAKAWEDKARVQESEISDLMDDKHRKDAMIAELQGKVTVLQDSLTGRASWEILENKIGEALQIAAATRAEIRQVHQLLTKGPT